jgi:hypothetical protein
MSSSLVQREVAAEGAEGVTEGAAEGAASGATFADMNRGTYLFDMDTILSVVLLFKFIAKSFVNFF